MIPKVFNKSQTKIPIKTNHARISQKPTPFFIVLLID